MMRRAVPALMLALAACGDGPLDPVPGDGNDGIRTVLFYREDTGRNFLLNSDGTAERAIAVADSGLVPVGHAPESQEVAFLDGRTLIVINLNDPARRDTLLDPAPASMSPVAFSPDGRRVALYQYLPEPRLLVLDRDGGVDTLETGGAVPDLPPVFSPAGDRVGLIGVNPISVIFTAVSLATGALQGEAVGISRFRWQPVFGWPRWTDEGVLLVTVRDGDGVDTLGVLTIDPADPVSGSAVLFRIVSPVLAWDGGSSYAIAPDARAVVVASSPFVDDRRRLYFALRGGRLNALLDEPGTQPTFPLVLP